MTIRNRPSRIAVLTIASLTFAFLISAGAVQSIYAPGPPNAKARAIQDGVSIDSENPGMVGEDIDCVGGIDSSANADSTICYLLPEGIPTPSYNSGDPSIIVQAGSADACPSDAGFQPSDDCFSTTYSQIHFTSGDYRFVIEFYASGELVDIAGVNFRNHTFFVIPESPIGAAALIMSSLAALGAFMYLRSRSGQPVLSKK